MHPTQERKFDIGYYLFILFTISYFFRLPQRFPVLGNMRFDFILGTLLIIIATLTYLSNLSNQRLLKTNTTVLLVLVLSYIILTIPLAQWPGTVLKQGLPAFLKIAVFYPFAVIFIKDEWKLKKYILIYLSLLLIIIIEPFILYLTEGRMGYTDYSMGEASFARLSGTTNNVGGNPNGLASIVAITFPMLFFLYKYYKSNFMKIVFLVSLPILLMTLVLTGSRSGLIATVVALILCLIVKSRTKVVGVSLILIFGIIVWAHLGDTYKQRYLSIIDETAQGRTSAEGRIGHIQRAFQMFVGKPVVGYGVGTYGEANWNLQGEGLVSHDFYTEVLVELGVIGAVIYFFFIVSLFNNIKKAKELLNTSMKNSSYPFIVAHLLETVMITQLTFSIFAAGLSYYIWYLLGGLSVVVLRIASNDTIDTAATSAKIAKQSV